MKKYTFSQSHLLCGLTVTLLPFLISANATLAAPPIAAPSKDATAAMPPQAGFYRMKLGQFTITALSDGTLPLPLHELLLDVTPAEIDRSLAHDFLKDPTQTSVNAYLIDTGSRLILVDTGAGDLFGPSVGFLNASLSAAGVRPEQISDVLLTHIHADHSGGLMNGKALAFPNATIHVAKRETDFWLNPANFVKATESNRKRAIEAHSKVDPYIKAGKVKTFGGEVELFPGIRTLAAPGHTPGHTIYALESQGQKLMFWGDIMHAASVQFPNPDVAISFDVAPKTAAITRQKLLRDAAAQRYWVVLDHVSFPGIGHVRAEKVGWSWAPINYSDDGTGQ